MQEKEIIFEHESRRSVSSEPTSERKKIATEAVNNIAEELDNKLNRIASLSDFIKYFISTDTYDNVESKYNGLVKIWELTGRDVSNSENVYNSIFQTESILISGVDSFLNADEVVETIDEDFSKPPKEKGKLDTVLNEIQKLINKVGVDVKLKDLGIFEIWVGILIGGFIIGLMYQVLNLLFWFVEILSHLWFYIISLILIIFLINLWKKK